MCIRDSVDIVRLAAISAGRRPLHTISQISASLAVRPYNSLKFSSDPPRPRYETPTGYSLSLIHILRAAPLIVKDAALAIADARAVREVTTTVSSLGRVALDPCMAPYVVGISALTSTSGLNFIVCTYSDDLSLSLIHI